MQIKYYRLSNGIINACAYSPVLKTAYKLYPNPDYIIDKSSWLNFKKSEKLTVPINVDKVKGADWIEHTYVDKCNLAKNLRLMKDSMPNKQRMQELLEEGTITTNPDSYRIDWQPKHPKTHRWQFYIKRVPQPPIELPSDLTLYDTFEEAGGHPLPTEYTDKTYVDLLANTPLECYEEVYLLLTNLPNAGSLPLRWRGRDLVIQSKANRQERIETLYSVPDDWKPNWYAYADKQHMIDLYLDMHRYEKVVSADLMALYPKYIKEENFMPMLYNILGRRTLQQYVRARRIAEALEIKLMCPDMSWWAIGRDIGYPSNIKHFGRSFVAEMGMSPDEWWKEHQYDMYIPTEHVVKIDTIWRNEWDWLKENDWRKEKEQPEGVSYERSKEHWVEEVRRKRKQDASGTMK